MKRKNKFPEAEYRAEEIKTLEEKRGALILEMEELIGKAKSEVRAFSEDETKRISEIEKEVEALNATIEAERRAEAVKASINARKQAEQRAETPAETQNSDITEAEQRAFLSFIQSGGQYIEETRAGEQNITMANNTAIIPTTIANRIITEVKEICPIVGRATMYNVNGDLEVPVWGDADGHNITFGYHEEFQDIVADAGKFSSVTLKGYLCSGLVLIGQSVITNSGIDVTGFIMSEIAKQAAFWIESEDLNGVEKIQGALATKNVLTIGSATAITADDLIDLQAKIPTIYQKDACWTMNPDTYTRIRKLKDANGQYLMMNNTSNISSAFPYVLLGKPVYLSDNMPTIEAGAKAILYGDYSGLSTNIRDDIKMKILQESFATKHAIGILIDLEMDSKITDHQKLAVLQMKATASSGS